jgi:hypothetical protein
MSEYYEGSLSQRDLPNGKVLVIYQMLFTYRLCVGWQGDMTGYSRAWCYEPRFMIEAFDALATWDGDGDPPGRWLKEVGTERRRHFDEHGNEMSEVPANIGESNAS